MNFLLIFFQLLPQTTRLCRKTHPITVKVAAAELLALLAEDDCDIQKAGLLGFETRNEKYAH